VVVKYAVDHAIEVVVVRRVVIDFDDHVFPCVAPHRIAPRKETEVVQHRGVDAIMEVATAAGYPFAIHDPWCDADLIRGGAHHGIEGDVVDVGARVVAKKTDGVVAFA
jgi:hypothetical protein